MFVNSCLPEHGLLLSMTRCCCCCRSLGGNSGLLSQPMMGSGFFTGACAAHWPGHAGGVAGGVGHGEGEVPCKPKGSVRLVGLPETYSKKFGPLSKANGSSLMNLAILGS